MFIEDISNAVDGVLRNTKELIDYPRVKLKGLLASVKGNARVLIISYLGYSIPIAWLSVYQAPYAMALGIDKVSYGNIVTIVMFIQVLAQLGGGILAGRISHKRTVDIFNLGWPLGLLLLSLADSILLVMPAMMIFSITVVCSGAWHCLFVEGIPKNKRPNIYAVVHMLLNGGAVFLIVAKYAVEGLGFIEGVRLLFFLGAITSMAANWYRWAKLKETKEGLKASWQKKPIDLEELKKDFENAYNVLIKNRKIFWFSIVNMLFIFALTMWGVFNTVFLIDPKEVGLNPSLLAFFPIISAAVFVVTTVLLIPRIKKEHYLRYVGLGILLNALSALFYVFAPEKNFAFIATSYSIYGVGLALFRPLYDARLMNVFTDSNRARLLSIYNTIVMLVAAPCGTISGYLYTLYPRSLYITTVIILLLAFWILWKKVKFKI